MEKPAQKAQTVSRRPAESGRVSYGDTVLLHESSRSRVVLVPFYIPRSTGTDLSIKIQTYKKGEPPMEWVLIDDKSISLNEGANRRLLAALREHLAVADDADQDGDYLVIPLNQGEANLSTHDPATVATALARALGHEDIARHLSDADLSVELAAAMRGAIRLREMRQAVAQLRSYLDEGEDREQVYQAWCEEHSWAFGNAYVVRDRVRNISATDNLDLLLPTVISGYRDFVELKRPGMKVLRWDDAHRNFYFSADTSRAIGQCHRYLDVLQEVAAKGLRDHPEIVAYHPRAILVIGRSSDWGEEKLKALHGLNARLSGIALLTYDHLLHQGERLVQMLSARCQEEDDEAQEIHYASEDVIDF